MSVRRLCLCVCVEGVTADDPERSVVSVVSVSLSFFILFLIVFVCLFVVSVVSFDEC